MSIQAALVGNSSQPLDSSLSSGASYGSRSGGGTVETTRITASPVGGVPPFTYAWSYVSGDNSLTATGPTSDSTTWTGHVSLGDEKDSTWKLVITDSASQVSPDRFIDISISENSFV